MNDDSRIYCSSCGELLDTNLRLIQSFEKESHTPSKSAAKAEPEPEVQQVHHIRHDDDDGEVTGKLAHEKKSSPLPWIMIGAAVLAVIVIAVIVLG